MPFGTRDGPRHSKHFRATSATGRHGTEESDARFLRDAYPELFFLIPGYGAQGGKARIAAALLGKAGGVVNSSRALLCAWKNDADLVRKADEGVITLSDMADAAARSALSAKKELCALA